MHIQAQNGKLSLPANIPSGAPTLGPHVQISCDWLVIIAHVCMQHMFYIVLVASNVASKPSVL